jgi:hypothetical protein
MFTLQILDRGQTLLHPLTGPELWIGSAPGLELQLQEEGVLPRHLRLTVAAAELRLTAAGPVLLNGNAVRTATLTLGDRLEVGRAVLVVGRTVSRPRGGRAGRCSPLALPWPASRRCCSCSPAATRPVFAASWRS